MNRRFQRREINASVNKVLSEIGAWEEEKLFDIVGEIRRNMMRKMKWRWIREVIFPVPPLIRCHHSLLDLSIFIAFISSWFYISTFILFKILMINVIPILQSISHLLFRCHFQHLGVFFLVLPLFFPLFHWYLHFQDLFLLKLTFFHIFFAGKIKVGLFKIGGAFLSGYMDF